MLLETVLALSISFLIKKGVSFLLMPLTIAVLLGGIALWYLYKSDARKARRYLIFSLVWLAFISSAPVANLLLAPLESQYSQLEKVPENTEYLLLLGGDKERRTWEVLRLYQQAANLKIITSGYSLYDKVSDAQKTATLLEESGIKKENILMQEEAVDTRREALAIKKRIGDAPFLLVTSAYHMPRAMQIFKGAGTNPVAAPADFNNPNEDGINTIFQARQILKTEHALHEYVGLLWLYIKNWSRK